MHLIIPYAASHALPASEAFKGLQLRNLQALLPQLQRQQTLQDLNRHPCRCRMNDCTPKPWAGQSMPQLCLGPLGNS